MKGSENRVNKRNDRFIDICSKERKKKQVCTCGMGIRTFIKFRFKTKFCETWLFDFISTAENVATLYGPTVVQLLLEVDCLEIGVNIHMSLLISYFHFYCSLDNLNFALHANIS